MRLWSTCGPAGMFFGPDRLGPSTNLRGTRSAAPVPDGLTTELAAGRRWVDDLVATPSRPRRSQLRDFPAAIRTAGPLDSRVSALGL